MQVLKIIKILCLLLLLCAACTYDNAEDILMDTDPCMTSNVSYSSVVSEILNNSCLGCHSNAARFGNVILEDFEDVRGYALSGRLVGSISHASGFSQMPQGAPKLDVCLISQIESWVNDGALNN